MSLKISSRHLDPVSILDLNGHIVLGEATVELRRAIRDLVSQGQKLILINLAEVNYIDSSGLGELVVGFTSLRKQGGDLKLLKLTNKVHDVLQITKLYTVFDIFDNEAAALASFTKNPPAQLKAS